MCFSLLSFFLLLFYYLHTSANVAEFVITRDIPDDTAKVNIGIRRGYNMRRGVRPSFLRFK